MVEAMSTARRPPAGEGVDVGSGTGADEAETTRTALVPTLNWSRSSWMDLATIVFSTFCSIRHLLDQANMLEVDEDSEPAA